VRLTRELTNQGLLDDSAAILTEQVKSLEQQELTSKTEAKLGVVKSELELINHQLMLALQKNQLYQTSRKKNKKKTKSKKIDIERLAELSTSQLGQDLWVLNETKYKRKGFFVEFGATDGVLLSNTYLLEREFGWEGICAEPNPDYFESLKKNRNCIVNNECIYSSTGKIIRFVLANEFGGIEKDALKGRHKEKVEAYKSNGDTIDVETISLNDVLIKYNAPINIDYMSIDTEGSELEILSKFDFKKWNVKLFTIEHNFEPQRDGIFKLLSKHGYQRIECKWDDFYIREIKRK
jgi:FkbM family methyltransferase